MMPINPIITTLEEQFVVGESDFAFFGSNAIRSESAAVLFCRSGSAEATVNHCTDLVCRNSLIFLMPGSMLLFSDRTADFSITYCAFSRDMFAEAAFHLEPDFFHMLRDNAIVTPPLRIVEGVAVWFQMVAFTYRDRRNAFRNTITKNRLQNVLLEIYDKMLRFASQKPRTAETTTRQAELFHRFVALVHEFSSREREVTFYADRLCISTRYLSTIVRNVAHISAKEFIDRSVMLEIKMLLQSTDLSVQEIAYRLRFPDQSYLGRFFKKHTGVSPTEYRNTKK